MQESLLITIGRDELETLIIDSVKAVIDTRPFHANTDTPTTQWLDLSALCEYLPEHPARQTVYGWITAGTIPYHKRGKRLYFAKSEIDEWLASGKRMSRQDAAKVVDQITSSTKPRKRK